MSKAWAWVAGIVVGVCILGLVLNPQAPRNSKGYVYVVVRGTTGQQAESKVPPANWLLIRRIPRP